MLLKENSTVIIPIDFSKQSLVAIRHSYNIARGMNCKLLLLHVYEKGAENHAKDLEKLKKEIEDESKLKVETLNIEGDIYEVTDKKAEELDASVIIVGLDTHVRFRSILGSNKASKFIKNAPCPVITIRSTNNKFDCKNIVLPFDLTPESREKFGLAIQLAKLYEADLRIISIFEPNDIKYENKLLPYLQQVKKFIKSKGVNCTNKSIPSNDPPAAIVEYANKNNCDLIMQINKRDRSIGDMFGGGTKSEKLVDISNVPVLSINPMQRASISTGIH